MKKGKLVEIKTKESTVSVDAFIETLTDEQQRDDSYKLAALMQKQSKLEPKMWGSSIIGFGNKRFKSPKTGREVEWFKMGFSPRKGKLALYLLLNLQNYENELSVLGKHKISGGCLYIKKLEDIDLKILAKLIKASLLEK